MLAFLFIVSSKSSITPQSGTLANTNIGTQMVVTNLVQLLWMDFAGDWRYGVKDGELPLEMT